MSNIGLGPCICGQKFDGAASPQMRSVHVRNCPQWLEHIQKAAKDPAIRQRIKTEGAVAVARSLGVSDCALINAISKADKLPRRSSHSRQGKLSKPKEVEYSPEQVIDSLRWLLSQLDNLRAELKKQGAELGRVRTALDGKELECKRLLDKQLAPIRFTIDKEIKTQALDL